MINVLSLRIKTWCLTGAYFGLVATLGVVAGGCGTPKERISDGKCPGIYQPLIRDMGNLLHGSFKLRAAGDELRISGERWYFIRDLGETRDPAAHSVLAKILQGDGFNNYEMSIASTALAAIGDPRALDVLDKAVETGRITQIQGVIAFGVLAVNGENAEALDRVLRATQSDQDMLVRCYAIDGLRLVNPNHAVVTAALERLVRSDTSMRVRARAACALVDHGDKSYWKFVNVAARDQDADVRLEVAESVPLQAEAIPVLLHLLGDKHRGVVFAAWEPLAKNLGANDGLHPDSYGPDSLESQRKIYRKAWAELQRK